MREFYEEIREKKKAANGVHSRKGKRGYVGKMLFPSDLMKGKEKRLYRKGGIVTVSNFIFDQMQREEFLQLDDEKKKAVLIYLRDKYSLPEIERNNGISPYILYKWIDKLGLPKDKVKSNGAKIRRAKNKAALKAVNKNIYQPSLSLEIDSSEIKQLPKNDLVEENEVLKNMLNQSSELISELWQRLNEKEKRESGAAGFNFEVSGEFEPADIVKRLEKLALLLEDETNKFVISLSIKEAAKIERREEPGREVAAGADIA